MREVIDFLRELRQNNDREWFNANKAVYKHVESIFSDFAVGLIDGIASFDDSVRGLGLKDCTYRIYRDTRFSNDKSPYKTYMGIYVAPHGKKAGYAGYYFHVEPDVENFLYAGLHMPSPTVLRSVREEIIDNGDGLMKAIADSNGFSIYKERVLKRNPKDFPAGHKYDELLRLQDFGVAKTMTERDLLSPNLLQRSLDDFRSIRPLVDILNRAVQYAYDEMM